MSNRGGRGIKNPLRHTILEMVKDGKSRDHIAITIGKHKNYVAQVVRILRVEGQLPAFERRYDRALMSRLTARERRWFEDNVPDGGTSVDLVAALVRDACAEDDE